MNTKACSVNLALGTSETGFSEEEKQICLQQLKHLEIRSRSLDINATIPFDGLFDIPIGVCDMKILDCEQLDCG